MGQTNSSAALQMEGLAFLNFLASSTVSASERWGFLTPPAVKPALRSALVASCWWIEEEIRKD